MSKESLEHIFELFYSTKAKMGTGLGLATVCKIIKQHNGYIWCCSEFEKGTIFKVYLPVCTKINYKKTIKCELATNLEGNETILLVEDDKVVRNLIHNILKLKGNKIFTSANGKEALSVINKHKELIDLILTDVVMAGMNGQELFAKVNKSYPGMKFLFMSGDTDTVITQQDIHDKDFASL